MFGLIFSVTSITSVTNFSRFDRAVWLFMAALLLLTTLVIWRGDQIGVQVLAVSPPPDSEGNSLRTPLRIRFDQPIDATSVNPAAFVLTPPVSGALHSEGDTLIFTPVTALAPATGYAAQLAPGLRSLQGHSLQAAVTWEFVTGQTSILYTTVDDAGREQLHLSPVEFAADAVTTAAPRALTQADYGIWDFAVDEHNGQIAYSVLGETGTSDIWWLPSAAEQASLLQACPEAACNSMAFSPDSRLLAFAQRTASDFGVAVIAPPRLWLLEPATNNAVQLFSDDQQLGSDPRWSPDGKWISYVSPDLEGIGVYHLDNGTSLFYATTTGEPAVWHPQSNLLVMSEMLPDSPLYEVHLYAIDPLRATRVDLSDYGVAVEDNSPAFSPDGSWIAFRRRELEGPGGSLGKQLWRMRADGSDPTPLTDAVEYDHGPPAWSPDGRYLLYHRFPLRGPEVTISVWIMDVTSGKAWEVARPGQRPQWVP
jgi:Tol biopolymer transport system component